MGGAPIGTGRWGSATARTAPTLITLLFCLSLPALILSSSEAGDERFDYDPLGRLIRVVDEQNRVTEYVYDPAGNLLRVITGGTATAPTVAGIAPDNLRRGESKRMRATGSGLLGVRLTSDSGLQLTDVLAGATQVDFTLSALDTAILGPQPITFTNAAGTTSAAVIISPKLPQTTVAPAPLAIPPDNTSRQFTIRLSNPDNIDHSFTLSSANTAVATVSPASVSIPAGQTEVRASITGRLAGQTTITLASATLGTTLFPVFVTAEFRGINTSLAPLVGVVVEQPPQPAPVQTITPFSAPHLGVVMGGYIQGVAPKALVVGTGPSDVTISGKALSGVTDIAIQPADGITLGSFAVNADGTAITVQVSVAANAPQTMRQLVLTAGPQKIPPATPDADRVFVAPPAPQVTSVDPLFVLPGTPSQTLVVRGRHFRNLQSVHVTPSAGIAVDSAPAINGDGTEITLKLAISPIAAIGPRAVTVATVSGISSAGSSPENTFTVVNELKDTFTPITAAMVGVVKEVEAVPASQSIGLVAAHVGISVGSVVTGITPTAESIGETFALTVQGFELQNVTAVRFVPDTGITVGALTVAADARSLTVPVTLAADAPLTLRTVQVLAGTTMLPSVPATATQFRVTTPQARIDSISPLFLQVGQAPVPLIIRGLNFRDLQVVRVVPSDGIALGAPSVNGSFTEVTVNVSAAANAVLGARVVVVETAAGATSSTATIANTLTLTNNAGATFTPIVAANLGILKEVITEPVVTPIGPIASANLGILVEQTPPPPAPTNIFLAGAQLGIAVGQVATGIAPAGMVRGTSATLTIQGTGLSGVSSISLQPAAGITLGVPQANTEGTQASVAITVAADAVTGLREVRASSNSGTVPFSNAAAARFFIAAGEAQIDSITPILATQGATVTLLIRGANFHSATAVTATPAEGIAFGGPLVVNSSGTEITIPVFVPADAPLGSRVIRVTTPAGTTTADAVPANTFTVFPP